MEWVQARWGIVYSCEGMRSVMKRNQLVLKVPRPQSEKANPQAQPNAKKGLAADLIEAECSQKSRGYFSDEMRFGLWGQGRRRWGLRGEKILQPKQIIFAWQHLVLAVDVIYLDLKWMWSEHMNQHHLKPIFEKWALETVI